jgi:hypothetical protein
MSTLNPKPTDDPHDFLVVAPDVARVVPSEEELSNLLREAARHHSDPQTRTASDLPAGPAVPAVDTTFRPAAVNGVQLSGQRRSIGSRMLRGFTALLLAACIGAAAIAWQSFGDAAKKMTARLATQFVLTASLPQENPGPSAQPTPPAVDAAAAEAAPSQPAPPPQTAPEGAAPAVAAPSSDSAQLLQSMARDLASVGQEVEQLKASIEQLRASQQQMSRDIAKVSENKASENRPSENRASENRVPEQNARPRIAALPPRPAAARARRPAPPPFPPPQAAAPYVPRQADYVPRQIEPQPQATVEPPADPELSSVPRPPMPVR